MLHAAAMLIGLFVIGMLSVGQWTSQSAVLVAITSVACVAAAARLGANGPSAFSSASQHLALSLGQAGAVIRGVLATMRAAVAADVTLKPALVRVKSRTQREVAQAAFANLVSAAPGMMVVETDSDGLLVHVNNEDVIDAAELGGIESRVIDALDARRGA